MGRVSALAFLGLVLVMCGGTTSSIDGGGDAAPDVPAIPCWSDLRTTQDRMCTANGDCAVLAYQSDCCGTIIDQGIRGDQVDPVHTAETSANASCSLCKCPPKPTVDDTGMVGMAAFLATCDMGLCTSHAQ